MAKFRFSQAYNLDRAVEAHAIHLSISQTPKQRWLVFILMAVIFSGLFSVLITSSDRFQSESFVPWIALSFGPAALLAWMPQSLNRYGLRRQIAQYHEQCGLAGRLTTYAFGDVQITIDDEAMGGTLAWNAVHAWRDDKDLLLIYRAPQFYYYIDKSGMDPSTLVALRERLISSPGKLL